MLRVLTRHAEDFNIVTADIDPAQCPYTEDNPEYASRVLGLYAELGVRAAIWTVHESHKFQCFESIKPVEYLLESQKERTIAYVDEWSWSYYLRGFRPTFNYSRTPISYQATSIRSPRPVRPEEVKEFRRYRANACGHCELVERRPWSPRIVGE